MTLVAKQKASNLQVMFPYRVRQSAIMPASCSVRPEAELILIAVLAVKVALLVKVDLEAESGAA